MKFFKDKSNILKWMPSLYVINGIFFSFFSFDFFSLNIHYGFIGIFFISSIFFYLHNFKLEPFTRKLSLYFIPFALLNLYQGYKMPCDSTDIKMTLSMLGLFAILILSSELVMKSSRDDWKRVGDVSFTILIILFIGIICEMIFPQFFPYKVGYRSYNQWSGFATEPSFLGQLIPILFILTRLSISKKIKNLSIGLLVFFCFFSASLTMVFLVFSLLFIIITKEIILQNCKKFYILASLLFLLVIVFIIIKNLNHFPYFYSRISFIYNDFVNLNFSGLVYIQAWLDAFNSFFYSSGLGMGLNQEGCLPRAPGKILELASQKGPIHQYNDNNVLLAKILYEWGFFGIIFFSYCFYRSMKLLSIYSSSSEENIFTYISIISILMFISRSNVYFEHTIWFLTFPLLFNTKIIFNK